MAQRLLVKPQGNPVGYDKDLVEQINKCLQARDKVLDDILAEPLIFAFGCGTTTGTGSITTLYTYGCTLEVQGTAAVARFLARRPNDRYVFDGLFMSTLSRTVNSELARKQDDECGIVFRDPTTGNPWRADNQVFSFLIWAMGPRS